MNLHNENNELFEVKKLSQEMHELYLKLNGNEYLKIPLNNKDLFAIVDKYFEKALKVYKWTAQVSETGVYAFTTIEKKRFYLHTFILEKLALKSKKPIRNVTFKNKLTLDCRFDNLIGYNRTNVMTNRRGKSNTTSKYKGVLKRKEDRFWTSHLRDKKLGFVYLGKHKDEDYAAAVYDAASFKIWGKNAYQNFPDNKNLEAIKIAERYIERRKKRLYQISIQEKKLINTKTSE